MADYRLYILDPKGHVLRSVEMQFPNDGEALDAASDHANLHGMELWQLGRHVHTFRPAPSEDARD